MEILLPCECDCAHNHGPVVAMSHCLDPFAEDSCVVVTLLDFIMLILVIVEVLIGLLLLCWVGWNPEYTACYSVESFMKTSIIYENIEC